MSDLVNHPGTDESPVVPLEQAGKWVAWSEDGMCAAGVGETPEEAGELARHAGVVDPIYEWVPPAETPFVGRLR